MKFLLLLSAILACTHMKDPQSEYLAVKCGHVFDPVSLSWYDHQTLLIKAGKIVEWNPVVLPAGTRKIYYDNRYVIPGLIDAHTHVFLEDPTMGSDFSRGLLTFIMKTDKPARLKIGEKRLRALLHAGFTTVRDLGNSANFTHSEFPRTGPRIFTSGPAFAPEHGQLPPGNGEGAKEYLSLTGNFPQEFGFDLVKLYADEEPNKKIASQKIFSAWVKAAHERNLPVASHAIFSRAIKVAIGAGTDTLEHGSEVSVADLRAMKKKHIIFVPTNAEILFLRPELLKYKVHDTEMVTSRNCRNIRSAKKTGVKVAFGSDNYFSLENDGLDFGRATLEILLSYRDCGMTPAEILRAATATAGETMGARTSAGFLSTGSPADFIVLEKNPLEDLTILRSPAAIFYEGKQVR